jgi:hypothetical protein
MASITTILSAPRMESAPMNLSIGHLTSAFRTILTQPTPAVLRHSMARSFDRAGTADATARSPRDCHQWSFTAPTHFASRIRFTDRLRAFGQAVLVTVLIVLSSSSLHGRPIGDDPTPEQIEFVRSKVIPILESRCYECHGSQETVEAELHVNSRKALLKGGESGAAIEPGEPDRSLIIQAVRYETFQMPPRSKMPDEEIEILVKWIKEGAHWPEDLESAAAPVKRAEFPLKERMQAHWAWKKIEPQKPPAVQRSDWPASPIDQFVLSKLEGRELSPAPDADRRALIRRVYFDLIGLPPTVEQQEAFFRDPSPTPVALEKVVDQLLASPQFGERWARHWLDLVRYGETLGHEFDFPLPHAWQYRDYVIRAINDDLPYDQFVREHIAGDLITNPRRHPVTGINESIIATGFWFLCEDKHAPVDVKAEEAVRVDNQIDVFGKTFLGLTIACARCHDHKFDAITTEDYYALSGFLQSSRRRVEWLDPNGGQAKLIADIRQQKQLAAQTLTGELATWDEARVRKILSASMADSAPAEADPDHVRVMKIRELLAKPETCQMAHPLSLLASLRQKPAEIDQATLIRQWLEQRTKAMASHSATYDNLPKSGNALLANLRSGLPKDWFAYGQAFDDYRPDSSDAAPLANSSRDTDGAVFTSLPGANSEPLPLPALQNSMNWVWEPNACRPVSSYGVSSAGLSPMLRGTLQSPEWELQHPEVHVLVAGRATRVRLVVDGYVMNEFTELLFSGLRQPIDTDGQFRWIRIAGDLSRYLGHRCHLEFLDEGDGWFAVKEVRLVANRDQTFEVPVEIAETNLQEFTPEQSSEQIVAKISASLVDDPAFQSVWMDGSLSSSEAAKTIQECCSSWRSLAEIGVGGDPVLVMCDGSGEEEHIFVRGNAKNIGPIAHRRLMTALDGGRPLANTERSGRLELADRVLADDNPFPARVAVNRVWQVLFGRGIVPSPDNFGVLGEAPSHPELLDYMADEFRRDGWSLKRLIRRMVLSRTYRVASQRIPSAEEKDPSNLLLHRFSVRRIESEVLRDSILAISGRLDLSLYGPPIPVFLTPFMQGRGRPGNSGPLDGAGRRSVYQSVNRNFLNPFMLTFDTPQPATTVGRRAKSNVPAQALIMLNSEFVHAQSDVWAKRLAASPPDTDVVALAYRQAFARLPDENESRVMKQFVQELAAVKQVPPENAVRNEAVLREVCHVLLNKKELLYLD